MPSTLSGREVAPGVPERDDDRLVRVVSAEVAALAPVLLKLSHRIHGNPELGHQEGRAAAWCAELLVQHGFEVERPLGGLKTAFRARLRVSSRPGPVIAFLAEYDALPGLGHACGHNIIAASAVGAGIALARTLEALGSPCEESSPGRRSPAGTSIFVDGTPAEETTGGKIPLLEQGFYRDVDAVLSMHPYSSSSAGSTCLGVRRMTFSFRGRAAHAAAEPERGINALDAVIQTFNNVNGLRQHVKSDVRIHGIITQGGRASNIVPDFAEAVFSVRSADMSYFVEVVGRVIACARGAALATGALLEVKEDQTYEPIRPNRVLTRLALQAMAAVGLEAQDATGTHFSASTDFGNVSQVTPAIAPLFQAGPADVILHHPDFCAAAGSPSGDAAVLAAAKVLAIVGARLALAPATLAAARADFDRF